MSHSPSSAGSRPSRLSRSRTSVTRATRSYLPWLARHSSAKRGISAMGRLSTQ